MAARLSQAAGLVAVLLVLGAASSSVQKADQAGVVRLNPSLEASETLGDSNFQSAGRRGGVEIDTLGSFTFDIVSNRAGNSESNMLGEAAETKDVAGRRRKSSCHGRHCQRVESKIESDPNMAAAEPLSVPICVPPIQTPKQREQEANITKCAICKEEDEELRESAHALGRRRRTATKKAKKKAKKKAVRPSKSEYKFSVDSAKTATPRRAAPRMAAPRRAAPVRSTSRSTKRAAPVSKWGSTKRAAPVRSTSHSTKSSTKSRTTACEDDPSYKSGTGKPLCPIWNMRIGKKLDSFAKHCSPGKTPYTRCKKMCKNCGGGGPTQAASKWGSTSSSRRRALTAQVSTSSSRRRASFSRTSSSRRAQSSWTSQATRGMSNKSTSSQDDRRRKSWHHHRRRKHRSFGSAIRHAKKKKNPTMTTPEDKQGSLCPERFDSCIAAVIGDIRLGYNKTAAALGKKKKWSRCNKANPTSPWCDPNVRYINKMRRFKMVKMPKAANIAEQRGAAGEFGTTSDAVDFCESLKCCEICQLLSWKSGKCASNAQHNAKLKWAQKNVVSVSLDKKLRCTRKCAKKPPEAIRRKQEAQGAVHQQKAELELHKEVTRHLLSTESTDLGETSSATGGTPRGDVVQRLDAANNANQALLNSIAGRVKSKASSSTANKPNGKGKGANKANVKGKGKGKVMMNKAKAKAKAKAKLALNKGTGCWWECLVSKTCAIDQMETPPSTTAMSISEDHGFWAECTLA